MDGRPHAKLQGPEHLTSRIVVRESRIGLGTFVVTLIQAGEVVVDWSANPLFEDPPRMCPEDRWAQISPGVYVGPLGPAEHPDTYINHSCRPNCEVQFARPTIHLVALRDIAASEEITFDYAAIYRHPWQMTCLCGDAACRRIIRGR